MQKDLGLDKFYNQQQREGVTLAEGRNNLVHIKL